MKFQTLKSKFSIIDHKMWDSFSKDKQDSIIIDNYLGDLKYKIEFSISKNCNMLNYKEQKLFCALFFDDDARKKILGIIKSK